VDWEDAGIDDDVHVIEKVVRTAASFEEAHRLDQEDVAALSFEERISGVERLRREWFGEDCPESRLERVLVCADRPMSALRARGRPRGRRSR